MSDQTPAVRNRPVPPNMNKIGVWAFESRHDETFFMEKTSHPFLKLLLIREGRGQIEFPGENAVCNSGDVVIVSPKRKHRIVDHPSAPISLYGLGVDLQWLKRFPQGIDGLPSGVYATNRFQYVHFEQAFRRLLYLFDQSDSASQVGSIASALGLIADLFMLVTTSRQSTICMRQRDELRDPMLEGYLVWLDRNFFESVSIDDAAEASGMSRRTFTTKFKERTGMTWLEYVNRLRVNHAVELLQHTERKISSIAFQSGFEDLSTFYRAFAKIMNQSPGECRSKL